MSCFIWSLNTGLTVFQIEAGVDKSLKSLTDKRSEEIKVRCNKITVEQIRCIFDDDIQLNHAYPGNSANFLPQGECSNNRNYRRGTK